MGRLFFFHFPLAYPLRLSYAHPIPYTEEER
jgi:hypothetical protein